MGWEIVVHEEMEPYNADFAAAVSVLHYVAAAVFFLMLWLLLIDAVVAAAANTQ